MSLLPELVQNVCSFMTLDALFEAVLVSRVWNDAGTRFIWELGLVHWRVLSSIGHLVQAEDSLTITVSCRMICLIIGFS